MTAPFRARRAAGSLRRIGQPRLSFASFFFVAASILALTLLGHDFLFPDSRMKGEGREKGLLGRNSKEDELASEAEQDLFSSKDAVSDFDEAGSNAMNFPPLVPGKLQSIDEGGKNEASEATDNGERLKIFEMEKNQERKKEYDRWRVKQDEGIVAKVADRLSDAGSEGTSGEGRDQRLVNDATARSGELSGLNGNNEGNDVGKEFRFNAKVADGMEGDDAEALSKGQEEDSGDRSGIEAEQNEDTSAKKENELDEKEDQIDENVDDTGDEKESEMKGEKPTDLPGTRGKVVTEGIHSTAVNENGDEEDDKAESVIGDDGEMETRVQDRKAESNEEDEDESYGAKEGVGEAGKGKSNAQGTEKKAETDQEIGGTNFSLRRAGTTSHVVSSNETTSRMDLDDTSEHTVEKDTGVKDPQNEIEEEEEKGEIGNDRLDEDSAGEGTRQDKLEEHAGKEVGDEDDSSDLLQLGKFLPLGQEGKGDSDMLVERAQEQLEIASGQTGSELRMRERSELERAGKEREENQRRVTEQMSEREAGTQGGGDKAEEDGLGRRSDLQQQPENDRSATGEERNGLSAKNGMGEMLADGGRGTGGLAKSQDDPSILSNLTKSNEDYTAKRISKDQNEGQEGSLEGQVSQRQGSGENLVGGSTYDGTGLEKRVRAKWEDMWAKDEEFAVDRNRKANVLVGNFSATHLEGTQGDMEGLSSSAEENEVEPELWREVEDVHEKAMIGEGDESDVDSRREKGVSNSGDELQKLVKAGQQSSVFEVEEEKRFKVEQEGMERLPAAGQVRKGVRASTAGLEVPQNVGLRSEAESVNEEKLTGTKSSDLDGRIQERIARQSESKAEEMHTERIGTTDPLLSSEEGEGRLKEMGQTTTEPKAPSFVETERLAIEQTKVGALSLNAEGGKGEMGEVGHAAREGRMGAEERQVPISVSNADREAKENASQAGDNAGRPGESGVIGKLETSKQSDADVGDSAERTTSFEDTSSGVQKTGNAKNVSDHETVLVLKEEEELDIDGKESSETDSAGSDTEAGDAGEVVDDSISEGVAKGTSLSEETAEETQSSTALRSQNVDGNESSGNGKRTVGVLEGSGSETGKDSLQSFQLKGTSEAKIVVEDESRARQLRENAGVKKSQEDVEEGAETDAGLEKGEVDGDSVSGNGGVNQGKSRQGSTEEQQTSSESKKAEEGDGAKEQQVLVLDKESLTANVIDLVGDPIDPQPMKDELVKEVDHQEEDVGGTEKERKKGRKKKKHNKTKGCAVDVLPSAKGLELHPFLPKFFMFNLRYVEFEGPPSGDPLWRPRFGGQQTVVQREASFVAQPQRIHCGFVNGPAGSASTGFTISEEDRSYMDECQLLVVSAVFGDWDHIRSPSKTKVSSWTRKKVCFAMFVDKQTLDALPQDGIVLDGDNKYGLWKVILVSDMPFSDPRKTGKIPKLIPHRLFPNVKYSIWVDSKLRLQYDPMLIWERFLWRDGYEYAISEHYDRNCVWQEVERNKQLNKYNHTVIDEQFAFMKADGLKPFDPNDPNKLLPSNVPEGSFIIRAHTPMANLFSCLWFNEVDRFTSRDQISFAYTYFKLARTNPQKFYLNMFKDCERKALVKLFRHKGEEMIYGKPEPMQTEEQRLENEEEIRKLAAQAASFTG